MLDDKDEFEVDGLNAFFAYNCPSCGGFREDGCSTCAQYIYLSTLVEKDQRLDDDDNWPTMAQIHVEVIRRMEAVCLQEGSSSQA